MHTRGGNQRGKSFRNTTDLFRHVQHCYYQEETKGWFCQRVILANVPSFRCLVQLLFRFWGSREHLPKPPFFMGLLMGLCRRAVFHHGRVPENCPLASMCRLSSLMGCFPTLMGHCPECLNRPFSLLKVPWKTSQ